MARSLLDDDGLRSIGHRTTRRPRGRGAREATKAIAAVSMFLLAAGTLSWHFGWIGTAGEPGYRVTPDDDAELVKQREAGEAAIRRGEAVKGDS